MTDHIYFLRAIDGTGPVKIGYSFNPEQRLQSFMQWSPVQLEIILIIPGGSKLERNLHNCFADDHSHSEWFTVSARLDRAIRKMQAGTPVHEAIDLTDIRGNVLGKAAAATRERNGSPPPWESRRANAARKAASLTTPMEEVE